jgi:hypothetical protein
MHRWPDRTSSRYRRTVPARFRIITLVAALAAVTLPVLGTATVAQATLTAPSAPTNVTAYAGEGAAEVFWTVGAQGSSAITMFQITAYHGGVAVAGSTQSVSAGAVGSPLDPTPGAIDDYVFSPQTAGTAVSYTVDAWSTGTGATSAMSNVVTPTAGPTYPYPPTDVTASASGSTVTVDWTVPPNNGSTITSFTIEAAGYQGGGLTQFEAGAGSSTDPTPGASDSASDTSDLIPGHTYTFSVLAENSEGTGGFSNPSDAAEPTAPSLTANALGFQFGSATVGDYVGPQDVIFTNVGSATDEITNISFTGIGADDYIATLQNCNGTVPVTLSPGASCDVSVFFIPGATGDRNATMEVSDLTSNTIQVSLDGFGSEGYYTVTAEGAVARYGDAGGYGGTSGTPLNHPIVGMAATGDDGGYWLVASDGGIFTEGDATFYGSTGALHLNKPIVGMAATPDAGGYWMVASDGGIFAFGDAPFYGSTGAIHLNQPIVGMAPTPDGGGYWLVASDGGIFAFGDAPFYGSTGNIHLNKPIVGMAPTPDGGGYWLVASDGGIFSFGDAQFYGSTGALHLNSQIVGMAATPDGNGYWFTASDGGIFSFGDAPFDGSGAGLGVNDVVGMAGDAPPTLQATLDIPALRHAADVAQFRHHFARR